MPPISTSIIILSYNRWDLTHRCLFELCTRLPETEIVVVDNGSVDEDVAQGISFWKKTPFASRIDFIMLPENKGFGGGNNIGAQAAMGDILVFTQTDVFTYGDWLTPLKELIQKDVKTVVGGRIIDWAGGWNNTPTGFIPYAEGWLLGMTREAWEDIGGFDERYFPCDLEDTDLSTMALYKGYKLVGLNSNRLMHKGGGTINGLDINRRKITEAHRELWLSKWSGKWDDIIGGHNAKME